MRFEITIRPLSIRFISPLTRPRSEHVYTCVKWWQNQVKRVLLIAGVEIEETSAFSRKYLKSAFGETEIKKTRNISFQSKFSGKLSCPLQLSPPHGVIVMNFVKTKPLNWNPLYIPVIWHKKEKSQNKILMKGNGRFSDSQTWMDHAILFIKRTPFVDIN